MKRLRVRWGPRRSTLAMLAAAIILTATPAVRATEEGETELAKKTQNPIADLVSVPLQNNFNFNTGEKDATVWILNVQPVVPLKLTGGSAVGSSVSAPRRWR